MWRCDCHGELGWLIRLPGEDRWPDGHVFANIWCTLLGKESGKGWEVTGDAPAITVSPSIHIRPGRGAPGEWHGFIRNGEVTPA